MLELLGILIGLALGAAADEQLAPLLDQLPRRVKVVKVGRLRDIGFEYQLGVVRSFGHWTEMVGATHVFHFGMRERPAARMRFPGLDDQWREVILECAERK